MRISRPKPALASFLLAVVFGCFPLFAGEGVPRTGPAAWYEGLVGLGPRIEHSTAESAAALYIKSGLAAMGVEILPLPYPPATHSFAPQFIARVPGSSPGGEGKQLVLALALGQDDSASSGEGGAWAIAAAMGLLQKAKAGEMDFELLVAFLGGEHPSPFGEAPSDGGLGSRSLVAFLEGERSRALIYLGEGDPSAGGFPSGFALGNGAPGVICPFWLHALSTESLASRGFSLDQPGPANILYRIGLYAKKTAIAPFLQAGIPSILLDPEGGGGSAEAFGEAMIAVGRGAIKETWDRHYLSFAAGSSVFAVKEGLLVYLAFAAIALSISSFALYSLVRRKRMIEETRGLASKLWILPLSYALVALCLVAGSFAARFLFEARGASFLDPAFAVPALALQLSLALAAFFALYTLSGLALGGGMGRTLSLIAGIALFLDTILYSFIDLSVAVFFLWSYLWALPAVASSSRLLRAACTLVSPLWLYFLLLDIALRPGDADFSLLLSPEAAPFLAFVLLPFLLLAVAIFVRRKPGKRGGGFVERRSTPRPIKKSTKVLVLALCSAVPLGTGLLCVLVDPYASSAQPVREYVDFDAATGESSTRIESPAPVPPLRELLSSEPALDIFAGSKPPAKVSGSASSFLGRETRVFRIESELDCERLELELRSPTGIVIHDANFPYAIEGLGKSARIFVGRRPGKLVELSLTLPAGIEYELAWKAVFEGRRELAGAGGRRYLLLTRSSYAGTYAGEGP